MEIINSIYFNASFFGVFLPFIFSIHIWNKYLHSSKVQKDIDNYFFQSLKYSFLLSICSILVSLIIFYLFYGEDFVTGKLLITNLLRVITAGLSSFFVRNLLVYLYVQYPDIYEGKVDIDKINKIFRYGVQAGFAAVIGLVIVIILQIQKV